MKETSDWRITDMQVLAHQNRLESAPLREAVGATWSSP